MAKQTKANAAVQFKKRVSRIVIAAAILALGAGTCTAIVSATSCSSVSECNQRISNLNDKNAQARDSLGQLQDKANSYQSTINELQQQINNIQASINKNEAEKAQLEQKITEYQAKIVAQKKLLREDIRAMYLNGGMSSLELIASAGSISDYVDQQEYRNVIQSKIQDTLTEISNLEAQVTAKKAKVEALLGDLSAQRSQLNATQAKQNQMLAYNQQQQADFTASIQANNAQIAQLQRQRQAAIDAISGDNGQSRVGSPIKYKNFQTSYSTCGGGYGYCWASFDERVYSDAWGTGLAHECVNFVSDWLARHGYDGPYNPGNANQWPGYGANVPSSQVRVGDVAYMPLAPVGHVGVVTGVNGDGTFHISQMNWPVGGYYSEMDLYPQNITFIRFPHN